MIKTITDIAYLENVALVTVNNIPNTVAYVSRILNIISEKEITVDMICQTAPYKNKINLSFTIPEDSMSDVIACTAAFKSISPEISTDINGNNTKVILTGAGMRNTHGVAAEVFSLFAENDIGVKLITTAETEISCLIDIKDIEKTRGILKNA